MRITSVENLIPGTGGRVVQIDGDPLLRRRLMEMGIVPGALLTLVRWAPLGDPAECTVRGYHLSVRRSEAAMISVRTVE